MFKNDWTRHQALQGGYALTRIFLKTKLIPFYFLLGLCSPFLMKHIDTSSSQHQKLNSHPSNVQPVKK